MIRNVAGIAPSPITSHPRGGGWAVVGAHALSFARVGRGTQGGRSIPVAGFRLRDVRFRFRMHTLEASQRPSTPHFVFIYIS